MGSQGAFAHIGSLHRPGTSGASWMQGRAEWIFISLFYHAPVLWTMLHTQRVKSRDGFPRNGVIQKCKWLHAQFTDHASSKVEQEYK